ncbi:MAG: hypothetical protein GY774_13865 [Planctomycetes bacterium]|nr:hypothetical protein [Planctomycetota bacterium]
MKKQYFFILEVMVLLLAPPWAKGDFISKIAFNEGGDIYFIDPDGNNLVNITNTSYLGEVEPMWSPDGRKIAFSGRRTPGEILRDIYVMNVDDPTNPINLTNVPNCNEEYPTWSPDGLKIAYIRSTGSEDLIYIMNADGTNQTPISSGLRDNYPHWSPDGTKIVFTKAVTPGHGQLFVINADGNGSEDRITDNDFDDFWPSWSPDGSKIMFLSTRQGNYRQAQIFVGDYSIGPDGFPKLSNEINITNNSYRHSSCRWSPDGTQIVFVRAPSGTTRYDLWIMNADGSNPIQLTNTPGKGEWGPDWSMMLINTPPVADAGSDQTVEQDSHAGASVTLDGLGSSDPDGDLLTYAWTWAGGSELGVSPTVTLPLGTTTITLVVNDGTVDSDPDMVDITVEDTIPPTINSISANPDVLWPPNHKMVEVTVSVEFEDICDPNPFCYIVGVSSNEPINDPGDGNTEPDWEFTDDPLVVLLRAERAGGGDGRTYTIDVECIDISGNTTIAQVEVTVPHDKGKGKKK